MTNRTRLSDEQTSQLHGCAAALPGDRRQYFVDEVTSALASLRRPPSNDELSAAITAELGVVPMTLTDVFLTEAAALRKEPARGLRDEEMVLDAVWGRRRPTYKPSNADVLLDGERLRVALASGRVTTFAAPPTTTSTSTRRRPMTNTQTTDAERDIARLAAARFNIVTADGSSGGFHRAGYRLSDIALEKEKAVIYDAYDRRVSSAWGDADTDPDRDDRGPSGFGERGMQGARAGDVCTVSRGGNRYGPEGSRGTMQWIDENGETQAGLRR